MGARLLKAYEIASNKGGSLFRTRLAMKFGLSSEKAKNEPDSPENIQKMEAALKEIIGETVKL